MVVLASAGMRGDSSANSIPLPTCDRARSRAGSLCHLAPRSRISHSIVLDSCDLRIERLAASLLAHLLVR